MAGQAPSVKDHYFSPHRRALVIVESSNTFYYSVDAYILLPSLPEEAECERSERVGVSLCYYRLSETCEAVIVDSGGRVELVNYRLRLREKRDPRVLADECDREAERLAELLRSPKRG